MIRININVEKGSPFDKSKENIKKEEPEKGKRSKKHIRNGQENNYKN